MKVYYKLRDNRIATTATADAVAKASRAIITVVYYSTWKKAVYLLGRRIYG